MDNLYKVVKILRNIETLSANQTECLNDALLKLGEESGELMGAYLDVVHAGYKDKTFEDVAGEVADVVQAALKIAFKFQEISGVNMLDKLLEKNEKWKNVSKRN